MATKSVSTIDSTDEDKEHLLKNGTKTQSNTNMDSTPINVSPKGKFESDL